MLVSLTSYCQSNYCQLKGSGYIESPYDSTFKGEMLTYCSTPLYDGPDMINCDVIGFVQNEKVQVIEKQSKQYYKVSDGTHTGYMWSGFFRHQYNPQYDSYISKMCNESKSKEIKNTTANSDLTIDGVLKTYGEPIVMSTSYILDDLCTLIIYEHISFFFMNGKLNSIDRY